MTLTPTHPFSLQCVRWWMCASVSVPINSMEQCWKYQSYIGMKSISLSLSHSFTYTAEVDSTRKSRCICGGWGGWHLKQHTDGFTTHTIKQTTHRTSQHSGVKDWTCTVELHRKKTLTHRCPDTHTLKWVNPVKAATQGPIKSGPKIF